jgi:hypothetical protein
VFAVVEDMLVKVAALAADPGEVVEEGTRVFWTDAGWREAVGLHAAVTAAGA